LPSIIENFEEKQSTGKKIKTTAEIENKCLVTASEKRK
jgi:hypothetical protein